MTTNRTEWKPKYARAWATKGRQDDVLTYMQVTPGKHPDIWFTVLLMMGKLAVELQRKGG